MNYRMRGESMNRFRLVVMVGILSVAVWALPGDIWAGPPVSFGLFVGIPAPVVAYPPPVYYPAPYAYAPYGYAPVPVYGPSVGVLVGPRYGYYGGPRHGYWHGRPYYGHYRHHR